MMSSGVAMEVHYCMGKKAGVDFYKAVDAKCMKCGMKEKKGCCHDEHKFFKLSNDHKNVTQSIFIDALYVPVKLPVYNFTAFLPSSFIITTPANAPPGIPQRDLNIRNCVFRI